MRLINESLLSITFSISLLFVFSILFLHNSCFAQRAEKRYRDKSVQVSIVPGIGSNGIHSAWYYNGFSFNLLSGISAGSKHLELAGISNISIRKASGIQLAGIANIVGINAFLNLSIREERDQIVKDGFKSDFIGFQISGLINYVRSNAKGLQATLGANIVGEDMVGIQLSGLASVVGKETIGFQISGLYNVAIKGVNGLQLSSLANLSKGYMSGTQVALFNKNTKMYGSTLKPPTKNKSLQIGLVNITREMTGGTQIGLLNISKLMGGRQIGIINFFNTQPSTKVTHNGTPIGILNFGSIGNTFRLAIDELFLINIERSTGNCRNCTKTQSKMPYHDSYQKFNQNGLIFSYNPGFVREFLTRPTWGIGYGFERIFFNKNSMLPQDTNNKSYFMTYGFKIQHLNWLKEWGHRINSVSSGHIGFGKSFKGYYLYINAKLCYYYPFGTDNKSEKLWNPYEWEILPKGLWPGLKVGIQL